MKIVLTTLFALIFTALSHAQEGEVNIQQDEKIAELLKIYKSANQSATYYRIQVGFGSYGNAKNIQNQVNIDFPNLSSSIDFDTPNYKVRIGRFKTKLEVERKLVEVRKKYPQAFFVVQGKSK
ncbi:SPOR domain-containing protein [Spongiimicrobium salis]|uniref:SPOR domain-containing protein n=1 Tax=Spongiimicrobium salis TaxID=1667022 RepID=UPI00374D3608